jgi:hypothetical protein
LTKALAAVAEAKAAEDEAALTKALAAVAEAKAAKAEAALTKALAAVAESEKRTAEAEKRTAEAEKTAAAAIAAEQAARWRLSRIEDSLEWRAAIASLGDCAGAARACQAQVRELLQA